MKKNRIFDRYGRIAAVDHKYTGEEPSWDGCQSWTIEKFMNERSRMFNFYNYYCSSKDLFDDLINWMSSNKYTKDQIKAIKSGGERCVSFTTMKLARAMNNGMLPTREDVMEYIKTKPGLSADEPHNDNVYVKDEVDSVIRQNIINKKSQASLNSNDDGVKMISPLERLSNKVNETIISELEVMIDDNDWAESQTKVESINLVQLLKANSIPVKGLKEIYNWLEKYETSLQNAIDKENEFDVEGWAFLSKPAIRNRLKAIKDMITQLDKYSATNKKVRKPRNKKVKSAALQIKKLNYKESDDTYGVQSVSPLNVPGSRMILTFNTKNRRLGIYVADNPIDVKGTTLKGWNEAKSFSLTIRKPDDIIPILLKKTEKQFTKVIDGLKTKRGTVNGRINKDTILLRTL